MLLITIKIVKSANSLIIPFIVFTNACRKRIINITYFCCQLPKFKTQVTFIYFVIFNTTIVVGAARSFSCRKFSGGAEEKDFYSFLVRFNQRVFHRKIGRERLYETKKVSCLHHGDNHKQLYLGKLSLPLTYISALMY
jgi:hypothetical protein